MKKFLKLLVLLSGMFTLRIVVLDLYKLVIQPWFTSYVVGWTWLGLITFIFCLWWTYEVLIFLEEEVLKWKN